MVLDGKARCLVDTTKVASFGPGDFFFGEVAPLDGGLHVTLRSLRRVRWMCWFCESREFWSLLERAPSISKKLLVALAQRERANATIHS